MQFGAVLVAIFGAIWVLFCGYFQCSLGVVLVAVFGTVWVLFCAVKYGCCFGGCFWYNLGAVFYAVWVLFCGCFRCSMGAIWVLFGCCFGCSLGLFWVLFLVQFGTILVVIFGVVWDCFGGYFRCCLGAILDAVFGVIWGYFGGYFRCGLGAILVQFGAIYSVVWVLFWCCLGLFWWLFLVWFGCYFGCCFWCSLRHFGGCEVTWDRVNKKERMKTYMHVCKKINRDKQINKSYHSTNPCNIMSLQAWKSYLRSVLALVTSFFQLFPSPVKNSMRV